MRTGYGDGVPMLEARYDRRLSAKPASAEVMLSSANGAGADLVPPWRPSASPCRHGRNVSANHAGASVYGLDGVDVYGLTVWMDYDFWFLCMDLMDGWIDGLY
uniref:Uncharacterized protein n=1 Tax=Oryza sativa subsp. japonica TaxID=39947 RepID=Q2QVD1_ORYSJ|nr:hypothetical protein LOC_Os12g13220 [Oryza sativa Japonica Group]